MLHFDRTPNHALAALAAALFLSTSALAQTYTAKAGSSIAGNEASSVASVPTEIFWDGSATQWTRHAFSRAERGALDGTSYCATYALYNMEAFAIAEFEYDDVIFTSPGSAPITAVLHLTIDGNSSVVNGNSFRVNVKYGNQHIGDASLAASGAVTSHYALSGWDMHSAFSFDHAITVPVNTPVNLKLHLDVDAAGSAGGHIANGHYTLRFGGAFDPCGRYEVFDLPAGVTVDSPTAGISDNLWASSSVGVNYCLAAPNSVSPSGAQIVGAGSAEVNANDLVLSAGPIPVGEFGLFFHGSTQVQLPFGEGYRCAGGALVRVGPPSTADGAGFVTKAMDNTGPHGVGIQAGVHRNFQLWYRDIQGGDVNGDGTSDGFSLSDGLEVCFY